MDVYVTTYSIYLLLSVGLTVWVARSLKRGGRRFLLDVFQGDAELADSVNDLLVIGFYLINLGYVALALKLSEQLLDARDAMEALSSKVGMVTLWLGVMHFLNLYVFSRLRRRAKLEQAEPPVLPAVYLGDGRPAGGGA